ncbi:hypothetical protein HDV00_002898 [Rhizophlyctis rosea]|nr:hypothetical protein HDV00_002898 [Rhizophlyctis rosea]
MTAVNNQTSTPTPEKPKVDSFEVGWLFVQEYYTFLNRDPNKLHCFFNKKSCFSHGHEGETVKQCHGQQEIHNRIVELDFQDCKVLVSSVDSQASLNGGIIVQVLGEMSNKGQASHKFAQTFFLAEQPNGYYVLNDIFRFLKEDIDDNEYEAADDHGAEAFGQEKYAEEPTHAYHETPASIPVPEAEPPKKIEKARSPSPVKAEPAPVAEKVPTPAASESVDQSGGWPQSEVAESGSWDNPKTEAPTSADSKPWAAVSKPKPTPAVEQEAKKPAARPQSPAPTSQPPANGKSSPVPPSNEPSKPKTWASLAAANATSWAQDAPGKAAAPAAPSTPAKQPAAASQAPKPTPTPAKVPAKKPTDDVVPSEEASDVVSDQSKDGGFREVSSRRDNQRRPHQQQQQHHDDDREKFSIYLKGINDKVEKQAVHDTFSKLGQVKNVDFVPSKSIGFVEFVSAETAQKAIGQSFVVNGQNLLAEERRRTRQFAQGGRGGGYGGRGRGGDFYGNRPQGGRGGGRGGAGPRPEPAKAAGGKPQGVKSQ